MRFYRRLAPLLLAVACGLAMAQPYPSRPIKIVVPATTGGAIDLIARSLAEKMSAPLAQPVIVENKPGAANNLGTDFVAKSPPDGYTLLIVASSHATNKHLYKSLPYDPVKDFEPVVYTHVVPLLLAVHPSVGANNVQELAAWIRPTPGRAFYPPGGPGTPPPRGGELLMSMPRPKMQLFPKKATRGAPPALPAARPAMIFDPVTA